MNENPNIRQLDDGLPGAIISDGITPPGFFVAIDEPVDVPEGDHRFFMERDGRHFLRVLHRVGNDDQVYLLEVFPEKRAL